MDKYEFNIKVEQIKKLVGKNDYETAMKIADTIDWRRVRNTNLLSMVAMVYEKNEDFQAAKEILLQAFERAPIGKRLLYKLAELAVKEGNIDEAEAYYKEFGDLASDDPRQQLLRYMILKAKGAPAQQLIHSLESYTSVELDEKWLYELAELYSLAGMPDRCVDTCDRIMLMFGLGKYVDKAMDLKIRYAPLTSYQMDLVENRDKYEARLRAVEQEYGAGRKQAGEPEEEYYDEDPVYDQEPDADQEMMSEEDPMEDDLDATMQEADAQEILAREMSKISYEEPVLQEGPGMEHTRVLEDIRRVGRPVPSVPGPAGLNVPVNEAVFPDFSEPVIEEEEPEIRETGVGDYDSGEEDYEGYGIENQEPDYAVHQSAVTAEDPEEFFQTPEAVCPAAMADEDPGEFCKQPEEDYDQTEISGADVLNEGDFYKEGDDEGEDLPLRNHLMIEARTPEKGLQLAVEVLKQIHRESGVKNPVAKITGLKLSKRGILASAEKLAGKDLVVEEAGDLTPEALKELNELMEQDASGMIVVLIDNPKQMEKLHQENPVLASKFECIGSGEKQPDFRVVEREPERKPINVPKAPVYEATVPVYEEEPAGTFYEGFGAPEYSAKEDTWQGDDYREDDVYEEDDFYEEEAENRPSVRDEAGPGFNGEEMDIDEFAQYACRYANEIDCSITGKSMLALYERIEIMEEDGIPLSRANAEGLIEDAADRAEKPSFGKRIKGLFSTKYDKDGLLILKEEHFIY
ncbi:tetratricopeptide repeat protein [Lachnospiraceae bacterium 54-53]